MQEQSTLPWKVSLHGGHCGAYCEHATGSLQEILDAAVAEQFSIYGLTEHAPRLDAGCLFESEVEKGYDVARLEAEFEAYAAESADLVNAYADRLEVLRGFEAEVVPADRYIGIMHGYRERYHFDYMVGSVHFLAGWPIDGPREMFEEVVKHYGGIEQTAIAYYEKVGEMVAALEPEVVGHLDLVRKNAPSNEAVDTPAIRRAAERALETIKQYDCILDLNTAGYRKDLVWPYPAPWLLQAAKEAGICFCFGDDAHSPHQVGDGMEAAHTYLTHHGITHIRVLTKQSGAIARRDIPLTPLTDRDMA